MEKKYKHYLVDDIFVTTDKEMQGYREIPSEVLEGMKPCEVLAELYKKAKERKEHEQRRTS